METKDLSQQKLTSLKADGPSWSHEIGESKPTFKRQPDTRYVPRNTERNKPCPCGSTKKAKTCCLNKVIASYHSVLDKIVPNLGKSSY